jgi:phosphonate transport system substrate-binding protein
MKRLGHGLLLWVALVVTLPAARAADVYSFGVVNQRSPILTARYWNPILCYVQQKSGVDLELKLARSGALSGEATIKGEYDFVYSNHQFKPSAAAQGYTAILKPRSASITSQIITLPNSGITSIDQLNDRSVGFASTEAFVGYAVPMDHLVRNGIKVHPIFGGSQQGIMTQLMAGNVVAAGVNSKVLQEFAKRENLRYRILWQSSSYPGLAISVLPRVPKNVVDSVQKAFAGMADDPQGKMILEQSAQLIHQQPPLGFLPATQGDYRPYTDFYRSNVFKGAD